MIIIGELSNTYKTNAAWYFLSMFGTHHHHHHHHHHQTRHGRWCIHIYIYIMSSFHWVTVKCGMVGGLIMFPPPPPAQKNVIPKSKFIGLMQYHHFKETISMVGWLSPIDVFNHGAYGHDGSSNQMSYSQNYRNRE
jgi:hypothetical protein